MDNLTHLYLGAIEFSPDLPGGYFGLDIAPMAAV